MSVTTNIQTEPNFGEVQCSNKTKKTVSCLITHETGNYYCYLNI